MDYSEDLLMDDEHDDDLPSTVDLRDEMETDDYPKTADDLEADEPADDPPGDDGDAENIVGK